MRIIGNLLWWIFGGLEAAIGAYSAQRVPGVAEYTVPG